MMAEWSKCYQPNVICPFQPNFIVENIFWLPVKPLPYHFLFIVDKLIVAKFINLEIILGEKMKNLNVKGIAPYSL